MLRVALVTGGMGGLGEAGPFRAGVVGTIPMQRLGKSEKIGGIRSCPASGLAACMTGARPKINGGQHYIWSCRN